MKWALVALLGLASCSQAIETAFTLSIGKTLDNGNRLQQAQSINFEVHTEDIGSELHAEFDFNPIELQQIQETTLYFANSHKEITQVHFRDGEISHDEYSKPWVKKSTGASLPYPAVLASKASVRVPPAWLPSNTSTISASILGVDADGQSIQLNYYGIKNFHISIPDTMIVESYKPVDLTSITASE